MNGKGDRQRPVDKDTYDKNYEEIDWGTKSELDLDIISKLEVPAIRRKDGSWEIIEVT
jgi:hypothetical protein